VKERGSESLFDSKQAINDRRKRDYDKKQLEEGDSGTVKSK
jgi:hypothetical protein